MSSFWALWNYLLLILALTSGSDTLSDTTVTVHILSGKTSLVEFEAASDTTQYNLVAPKLSAGIAILTRHEGDWNRTGFLGQSLRTQVPAIVVGTENSDNGGNHKHHRRRRRHRQHQRRSDGPKMIPAQPWMYPTNESCAKFLDSISQFTGDPGWCQGVTDEVLCWPATSPGTTINQLCPRMQGVDPTKYAVKICGEYGKWKGLQDDNSHGQAGYTDYNPCFTEDTKSLFEVFLGNSNDSAQVEERFAVLTRARTIEIVGFPLSLVCVLISLFIFRYFRALRCSRTTIHVHLFIAIAIMTLCKTIEISDQFVSGYIVNAKASMTSIRSMRPLCEILVVLIEYSRTAMFMWMFLEGLYMHNVVAWKVFEASKPNYWLYGTIGWGFPALLVSAWAPVIEFVWMHEKFQKKNQTNEDQCWYQHNESHFYNILEVPRLFFIAINLLFLINIIRVLLTKLRDSHQSDTVQIRKAVKAAIVLAPLLGVTHLIWAVPPPIDANTPYALFACWMYVNHFLRSFEGCFVSLAYCFLNGEVQHVITTLCQRRAMQRETNRTAQRRVSSLSSSHLTRYMQVNRSSVQSDATTNNHSSGSRQTTNRFLKLLPCWATGSARSSRKHSSIPNDNNTITYHNSTLQLPFNGNGTIMEEKEENIEM